MNLRVVVAIQAVVAVATKASQTQAWEEIAAVVVARASTVG